MASLYISGLISSIVSGLWLPGLALLLFAAVCVAMRTVWRQRKELARAKAELERRVRDRTKALVAAKARFETLVLASAEVVWTANAAGEIVEDSPSWCLFTGQSVDEYLGWGWLDAIHPDDRARVKAAWEEAIRTQGIFSIEYRLHHVTNEWRWMAAKAVPPLTDKGTVREWVGMNTDITARRLAEEALRDSEEKLREAQKIAEIGSWDWELDTGKVRWSDEESRILGLDPKLPPPTFEGFLAYVRAEDKEKVRDSIEAMQRTGEPFHLEYRIRRSNGDERILDARGRRYEDAGGRPVRLAGTVHDITDLRQIEDRLAHSLKSTVAALANTLEVRDVYTAGHQHRVAQLAAAIAREMKFSSHDVEGIFLAGVIHDIGKIQVPLEILSKPGKLTKLEFQMVQCHAETGYGILKDIDFVWPIADMVHQHHERLDGSGYPLGLKGDAILPGSRVIMVADVVDAVMSHRPYRASLGLDTALGEIEKNRGVYYDPAAVDACLTLFREKSFNFD